MGTEDRQCWTRPAPLSEVAGPQGVAVTVGYVAAGVPSVATPLLAAPVADGVGPPRSPSSQPKRRRRRGRMRKKERQVQAGLLFPPPPLPNDSSLFSSPPTGEEEKESEAAQGFLLSSPLLVTSCSVSASRLWTHLVST